MITFLSVSDILGVGCDVRCMIVTSASNDIRVVTSAKNSIRCECEQLEVDVGDFWNSH